MEKLMKIVIALGMALSLAHCAEKKDNNNQAVVPVGGQYYMNNLGQCVSPANPTAPMPATYCQGGMGGGQYYINQNLGGQCVATTNPNVPVPMTYCQNGGMGGTGGIPQVCIGTYCSPQWGCGTCQVNPQTGMNNCSGYTLYNQQNQQVLCQ